MDARLLYDNLVAHRFDEDPFHLYGECRALALDQIRRHVARGAMRIVDLGCGTGGFLAAAAALFPEASLFGIDGSEKMLKIARGKVGGNGASRVRFFHDDVLNLEKHVEPGQVDLAALHFVMTRVDNRELLKRIHRALRPGGWCSIATGTHESFPILRSLGSSILSEEFIRSSSSIPGDRAELHEILREAGLQVLEESVHRKTVRWTDFDGFRDFVFHSGWFPHPMIMSLEEGAIEHYREVSRPFFPIEDIAEKTVVLARKA